VLEDDLASGKRRQIRNGKIPSVTGRRTSGFNRVHTDLKNAGYGSKTYPYNDPTRSILESCATRYHSAASVSVSIIEG
jgi:hypothetical protein